MDWPIFFVVGLCLGCAFGFMLGYVWYDGHR